MGILEDYDNADDAAFYNEGWKDKTMPEMTIGFIFLNKKKGVTFSNWDANFHDLPMNPHGHLEPELMAYAFCTEVKKRALKSPTDSH